jgi:hypothetical protein
MIVDFAASYTYRIPPSSPIRGTGSSFGRMYASITEPSSLARQQAGGAQRRRGGFSGEHGNAAAVGERRAGSRTARPGHRVRHGHGRWRTAFDRQPRSLQMRLGRGERMVAHLDLDPSKRERGDAAGSRRRLLRQSVVDGLQGRSGAGWSSCVRLWRGAGAGDCSPNIGGAGPRRTGIGLRLDYGRCRLERGRSLRRRHSSALTRAPGRLSHPSCRS